MRNKAALFVPLLVAVLAVSCGAGAEKQAFDEYELQVSDVLEKEAEIRQLYEEEYENMTAYGRQESFDRLVRQKMIPFYAEMEETVNAVSPEGEELKKVHVKLIEYVTLRRELFTLDTKASELSELEKPALERLNLAVEERDNNTREFNDALMSSPELMQRLAQMFSTEQQAAMTVVQSLQRVRGGETSTEDFLKFMDEKVDPFYENVVKQLAEMKVSMEEQAAMLKAKAYVGSTMAFFLAAREVAKVRPDMLDELKPLRARYEFLLKRTVELIDEYRKDARAYRDSLR
jgi:hypothetical protein